MKPEVEIEMNGEVTDQAPQLIHCPLDTQVKRGPAFLVQKYKLTKNILKKSKIPYGVNVNWRLSGGVIRQFILQTLGVSMPGCRYFFQGQES